MTDHRELIEFYRSYGESSFSADEPAYAEVCRDLADYPRVVELLAAHDPAAQQPNLLFAAVHYLLLGGLDHPLARVYGGTSDAPVMALFADLVLRNEDDINQLLTTQRTQTNEVGRSAVLAVVLNDAQRRIGQQVNWIDLGASGGLNLNVDRFRINYSINGHVRSTGDESSGVSLNCEVRTGQPIIESSHAAIGWRIGVDRAPIDVTDPDRARWLQACLWPSRLDRHVRLEAAIAIAREFPPSIVAADAVDGVAQALAQAPTGEPLVMTTTWVWYYLPESTQLAVLDVLRASKRRVLWYSLEGRGVVAELNLPREREAIDSMIGFVDIDRGEVADAQLLGMAHAHGTWISWY